MRLKDTFITHDSQEGQILIDVSNSFAGLLRSNQTAAFIIDCLGKDTTKEQLVDRLYERYDASRDVLEHDTEEILEKLRKIGALEE